MAKDKGCFLHPSCAGNADAGIPPCPELICVYDFPGGVKAFLRMKQMREMLTGGMDMKEIATELSITVCSVQRRYNKTREIIK